MPEDGPRSAWYGRMAALLLMAVRGTRVVLSADNFGVAICLAWMALSGVDV